MALALAAAPSRDMTKRRSGGKTPAGPEAAEKTRPDGRGKAHELRFGTREVAELQEDVEKLQRLTDALDGAIKAASEEGMERLFLDGVTKIGRAIDLLKSAVPNVRHAIEKERMRGGMF